MAAWAGLGAVADGYDPMRDAISRLAALGTPTRPAMTAGLLALAAGTALYGLAQRPDPAWVLPVANAVATLGVAVLPLGGGVDAAHGVAAGVGYITLAAIPAVLGRRLGPGLARLSLATGLAAGACLLATTMVTNDGLFQRLGLTIAHAWIVADAAGVLRRAGE